MNQSKNPVTLIHTAGHGWHWRQILPGGKLSGCFVLLQWETIPENASEQDRKMALQILSDKDEQPF